MKATLKPGLTHRFSYEVPENKTVPFTYPEAPEISTMPKVFATGFMVVLFEWTCIQLLEPYLDAGEGSLGVQVNVTHSAATLPGQTVKVEAVLTKLDTSDVRLRRTFVMRLKNSQAADVANTVNQYLTTMRQFDLALVQRQARNMLRCHRHSR